MHVVMHKQKHDVIMTILA